MITDKALYEELENKFPKTEDGEGNRYVDPVEYKGKWYIYRSGGFGWDAFNNKKDAHKAMFAWGEWLAAMDAN